MADPPPALGAPSPSHLESFRRDGFVVLAASHLHPTGAALMGAPEVRPGPDHGRVVGAAWGEYSRTLSMAMVSDAAARHDVQSHERQRDTAPHPSLHTRVTLWWPYRSSEICQTNPTVLNSLALTPPRAARRRRAWRSSCSLTTNGRTSRRGTPVSIPGVPRSIHGISRSSTPACRSHSASTGVPSLEQGLTLAHFRAQLEDLRDTSLAFSLNFSTLGTHLRVKWGIWGIHSA